jgi:NADPH:quinone reductase-like Zn-dependent oxidoreductase
MAWQQQVLEVNKTALAETRIYTREISDTLEPDEVVFEVDRLAMTSNNISYAVAGDMLDYWGFFPTDAGWGRIPAMGWADVVASAHPDINVGERVWGFFPYANYHKIAAGQVTASSFRDIGPHRTNHAPVYCQFDKASANPLYDPAREGQDSLLRGLFMTSWLVEDFLNENAAFGAELCLITSASSKTSIALAYAVKQRGHMKTIAITSDKNRAFCESLGCYDAVYSYQQIEQLDANSPAVIVDMAGSAATLVQCHQHFGGNMKYSCLIGATHYQEAGATDNLPGAKPEFFFAPAHVQERSKTLGGAVLMTLLGESYAQFRVFCDGWIHVQCAEGPAAVSEVYRSILTGGAEPQVGQLVKI